MKRHMYLLAVLLFLVAISTRTQDKLYTDGLANCRYWNTASNNNEKAAYLLGFQEGVTEGALTAGGSPQDLVRAEHKWWADKLTIMEIRGRLDTYCSDAKNGEKALVDGLNQIANDMNKP